MRTLLRLSAALALVSLVALLVCPAFGGTRRDDRSDNLYLNLGAQSAYASVGKLSITTANGNYLGSGTLISPNWVLTAAHCVSDASALNFSINGQNYAATTWVANSGWTGDPLNGYDFGLVELGAPVSGVTPATRYTGTNEVGAVGTTVGYGMTGTGKTGAKTYDGKKRAGQNSIDQFFAGSGTSARILLEDFDNPKSPRDSSMGSNKPLDLEYMVAPGDSGGGLFVNVGGKAQLAGVTSFIWGLLDGKPDSDYGDVGGFGRVSAFNSWIDGVIASLTPAALTDQSLVFQTNPAASVPEPATLTLIGMGLGGLILARRRRRAAN